MHLKRIERRAEVHFVDRVARLLQHGCQGIGALLRRRTRRRFLGSFPLGLRQDGNSCRDKAQEQEGGSEPLPREIIPEVHGSHLLRATEGGAP